MWALHTFYIVLFQKWVGVCLPGTFHLCGVTECNRTLVRVQPQPSYFVLLLVAAKRQLFCLKKINKGVLAKTVLWIIPFLYVLTGLWYFCAGSLDDLTSVPWKVILSIVFWYLLAWLEWDLPSKTISIEEVASMPHFCEGVKSLHWKML